MTIKINKLFNTIIDETEKWTPDELGRLLDELGIVYEERAEEEINNILEG